MRITEVRYRRVANLGHFETATIEVTVAINELDDPQVALGYARAWAELHLEADRQKKSGPDQPAR